MNIGYKFEDEKGIYWSMFKIINKGFEEITMFTYYSE